MKQSTKSKAKSMQRKANGEKKVILPFAANFIFLKKMNENQ